jgi:hypothetical protein
MISPGRGPFCGILALNARQTRRPRFPWLREVRNAGGLLLAADLLQYGFVIEVDTLGQEFARLLAWTEEKQA